MQIVQIERRTGQPIDVSCSFTERARLRSPSEQFGWHLAFELRLPSMIAKARLRVAVLSALLPLVFSQVSSAQTALSTTPSISVAEAQRRFEEGVKAYDQKNYEAARVAFAQAYALEPLPQLLVNLGHMELRTARFVEGARHLSQALREADIGVEERRKAEEALKAAEQKVGRVQIELNVDGATLVIDDDKVGTSPMIYAWYVEPGEHRVRASKKGYAPRDEVFGVSKAQTKTIRLSLEPMDDDAAETTAASAHGDSFFPKLSERERIPLWIGGGLTLAGLGTGVAFALLASGDRTDRDQALSSLQTQTGIANPCAMGTAFETRCDPIDDSDRTARHRQVTSNIGFIFGGAAAAATLTYWFWPRSNPAATNGATRLELTPMVSSKGVLLQTSGSF
jgi:hypothetical protein